MSERTARWTQLLDDTVAEVFGSMFGCACTAVCTADGDSQDERNQDPPVSLTIRVDYSGALNGDCNVALPEASAACLAEIVLGPAPEGWDQTILADTAGELCNMVAGGWKRRLGPPMSAAGLSVPRIVPASLPPTESARKADLRRAYIFQDARFVVTLTIL